MVEGSKVKVISPLLHLKFLGVSAPDIEVAFSVNVLFICIEKVIDIFGDTGTSTAPSGGVVFSTCGAIIFAGFIIGYQSLLPPPGTSYGMSPIPFLSESMSIKAHASPKPAWLLSGAGTL